MLENGICTGAFNQSFVLMFLNKTGKNYYIFPNYHKSAKITP